MKNMVLIIGLSLGAGVAWGQGAPQDMVLIPAGAFLMGSAESEPERDDDEAPRQVVVGAFYMGRCEVTQAEYAAVMGSNPSDFRDMSGAAGPTANLPVENVSWYDAVEYCNRRSAREGLVPAYTIDKGRKDKNNKSDVDGVKWTITWNRNADGYRLPTEVEWEYACRAGTTTPFCTGDAITTEQANYDGRSPYNAAAGGAKGAYREEPWDVGSGAANAWGLYDTHGNVWEWCWDWYGDYPREADSDAAGGGGAATGARSILADAAGPAAGAQRVNRGGSWLSGGLLLRSAYRHYTAPSMRSADRGFRLARNGG